MNGVLRSAVVGSRAARLWSTPVSFFHSTPFLERKRRSNWHPRFNYYEKRKRKMESKRALVRNLEDYAEYLFQSWRQNSSVHEEPWFRRNSWTKGVNKNGFGEPQSESYRNKRNGAFEFCLSDDDDDDDDDDEDVETIFRSAFGGAQFSYQSFNSSQDFQWNSSGHGSHRSSRSWTYETDDETDDETDASIQQEFISERLALGLRTSGPLKLKEVKNAYRSCALKWHPDRHQGSSKETAEEKFKNCSAAYETLCNKLPMD